MQCMTFLEANSTRMLNGLWCVDGVPVVSLSLAESDFWEISVYCRLYPVAKDSE